MEWQKKFEKNATDQSLGTGVSRVAGFLRDSMMTALFDRVVTDAWVLAFRGPHFFRRYLGEGAVSQEFQSRWGQASEGDIAKLRFLFLSGSFLLMGLVILFGWIFLRPMFFFSLGSSDLFHSKIEEFFYPMVMMIGAWFYFSFQTALLHRKGDFRTPAVAPVFLNLAMILWTVFAWWTESPIYLSWGVAWGGVAVMLYAAKPWTFRWTKGFIKIPQKEHISWFLQLPFVLLPLSLLQWVTLLQIFAVARLQQPGTPSYFYLCDRLLELPFSLFVISPCLAMTQPLMESHPKDQSSIFTHGLFSIFIWIAPATLGLWMMSDELVQILFQHGRFHAEEVLLTRQILKSMALQLFVMSGVRVWMTWFLVQKKQKFLRRSGGVFILLQALAVLSAAKDLQQVLGFSLVGVFFYFLYLLSQAKDLGSSLKQMFFQKKFLMLLFALFLLYLWLITPTSALFRLVFAPLIYFAFLLWFKVWSFKSKV